MLIQIRPDQIEIPTASELTPKEVYLSRRHFIDHPPGADWDGVHRMTSK